MFYKLNKMYDNLESTHPCIRFLIFLCICIPIAFIPNESYKILILFVIIMFRLIYFDFLIPKQRKEDP